MPKFEPVRPASTGWIANPTPFRRPRSGDPGIACRVPSPPPGSASPPGCRRPRSRVPRSDEAPTSPRPGPRG
ncbi:hypothetical protein FBR05_11970 [Deltaproteobacteria bacterium PRO3]|nr:hypothetical protein [Deltaproteobacteria bacterium PRO3]